MKSVFKKIRLPRKVMFVLAGVLVLGGASGAFAVYSAKDMLLGTREPAEPSTSGLACTAIETLKMRRNGQRWIRRYVSTESSAGIDRVRTGLRIAGLLARDEKADLYQVVVLDAAGPSERAARRGPAIGAEVLFAPDPGKVPGMKEPFVARYNESNANTAGLFHGREIALSTDDIKTTLMAMTDKSDCFDPVAAAAAAEAAAHGAAGSEGGGHGEDAETGHGDEAAADHGEAAAEHDAEDAEPQHGAEAESAHDAVKVEEKGFLGSMIALVLGESGEGQTGEGHATQVSSDHDSVGHAAETSPSHADEKPVAEPAGH